MILFDDFIFRLENQCVMRIPSGQEPAMYSKMHLCFHKELLIKWSNVSIKDSIIIEDKDKGILICPRFMKSLKEYKLNLYPAYSKEEIDKYRPQNIHF